MEAIQAQVANFQQCTELHTTLFSLSDLNIESCQSYGILTKLLREEADYIIDENGWVMAWGAAPSELNCKSMEFSNYPYDKHKCEFLIRSDYYPQVCDLIRKDI